MENVSKGIELGFTKESYPELNHVCLIYDSEEERQKIVAEFLAAGIRDGEMVRYFSDKTDPALVRSWLKELGINVPEVESSGNLFVGDSLKAYCPNGYFNPVEMIEKSKAGYKIAESKGQTCVRSCGEMSWALSDVPGSERLLEYENLLNTVEVKFPHIGMCQYDARLFDGATLFKILQVHPYMVAKGQIIHNPYFVKHDSN